MTTSRFRRFIDSLLAACAPSTPSRPQAQLAVGTIVIACPDNGKPMMVGPIVKFDGRFGILPVVRDVISGKTMMCASPMTRYSLDVFHHLVGLTPDARVAHITRSRPVIRAKPHRYPDLTQAQYLARLHIGLAKLGEPEVTKKRNPFAVNHDESTPA